MKEKNIGAVLVKAASEVERIADTHGVARAKHISVLADYLVRISGLVSEMMRELEELREYKAENEKTKKPEDSDGG